MAEQELKWWHVRWRSAGRGILRFAVVFGKVIGVLCAMAAIGYGAVYLISPWLVAQRMNKIDPRVSIVPANPPTKAEARLSSTSIDCYGFRIALPKEEITRTIHGDSVTVAVFRDGGDLIINNTARERGIIEIAMHDKLTQRLFAQETIRSQFQLLRAAMRATPEQSKWWRFRTIKNLRLEYLLVLKSSLLSELPSPQAFTLAPIYTVDIDGFRGFQIGNPDVAPYEAHLDLFDRADQALAFDVTGPEGHKQVLTQAEVNAVVASIQATSDR